MDAYINVQLRRLWLRRRQLDILYDKYRKAYEQASQPGLLCCLKAKWYRAKCDKYLRGMCAILAECCADPHLVLHVREALAMNVTLYRD